MRRNTVSLGTWINDAMIDVTVVVVVVAAAAAAVVVAVDIVAAVDTLAVDTLNVAVQTDTAQVAQGRVIEAVNGDL